MLLTHLLLFLLLFADGFSSGFSRGLLEGETNDAAVFLLHKHMQTVKFDLEMTLLTLYRQRFAVYCEKFT